MKFQIIATALALSISSMATASSNQFLCTTTSFEAFGEPKQTVRDCADPDETFWVAVTIDGVNLMPQGIGLIVPQTSSRQRGDEMHSLTVQVTKKENEYTVRFQQVSNGQSIYWSGIMLPGHQQDVTIKGHKINILFERQNN